jgi:hypothetical protein
MGRAAMCYHAATGRNFGRQYPCPMPILNESRIRAAKPAEKPCKLFDERGLFMLVTRTGRRL